MSRDIRCPRCAGSGYDGNRPCRWCMGTGLDSMGSASDQSNVVLAALCLLGVIFLALIGAGL